MKCQHGLGFVPADPGELILHSIGIAVIVLASTFGGAVVGLVLRALLPDHHLSNESRDIVKLGTGLIATMAASSSGC